MGVLASWLVSSVHDSMIPPLREPVLKIFEAVVESKGLPSRAVFRDLRNQLDMIDYQARESNKGLMELKGAVKRLNEEAAASLARAQAAKERLTASRKDET